jgi:hypothetical protein
MAQASSPDYAKQRQCPIVPCSPTTHLFGRLLEADEIVPLVDITQSIYTISLLVIVSLELTALGRIQRVAVFHTARSLDITKPSFSRL